MVVGFTRFPATPGTLEFQGASSLEHTTDVRCKKCREQEACVRQTDRGRTFTWHGASAPVRWRATCVTEAVVSGELDDVGLWRRWLRLAHLMLAVEVEAPGAEHGGDEPLT